jgi:release factor glutamine methyltransferase
MAAARSDRYASLLGLLEQGLRTLDDKPEETPDTALRALWMMAAGTGLSPQAAAGHELPPLTDEQHIALDALIQRRLQGVPLAHLTGHQRFMDVELLAGAQALIPRRETELLGRAAAQRLACVVAEKGSGVALDVCTGSGNLALGIACAVPGARLLACDLSEDAVALARANVAHLGLEHRVEVRQGDLLAPFDEPAWHGAIDVLICNPPYISSAKVPAMAQEISQFEPALAFDGGPFGVRILNRLIQEAPKFIRDGGWLAFEVGAGQGPSVMRRLASTEKFRAIEPLENESGEVRAFLAQHHVH